MLEGEDWSERPLCIQNHALNQHYILHNHQLTQLTNIYRPKPQLMLLLACAHWEFPNIEKVWYFASRRGMLALFILADGQCWATIVFDPLERKDTKQIYRWEVRTEKITESLKHKTGQRWNSQKNSTVTSQGKISGFSKPQFITDQIKRASLVLPQCQWMHQNNDCDNCNTICECQKFNTFYNQNTE